MKKLSPCTSCKGSGSVVRQVRESSTIIQCPKCGGTGQVVVRVTESGLRESRVLNEG